MTQGTCPVCKGTCRVPVPQDQQQYKTSRSGYDPATDTFPCTNCGAQYMFGVSTGLVKLDHSGQPCTHQYEYKLAGRCYHRYTCKNCGDVYYIDSGD